MLALALSGCGGGGGGGEPASSDESRAFVSAMAEARLSAPAPDNGQVQGLSANIAPVRFTADDWFTWAESTFPDLFPSGPVTQTVFYGFRNYLVRYYPEQDVHLGVSADGHVYALGAFTNQMLSQYGQLANYACITDPASCEGAAQNSVAIYNWAGTQHCMPNDFQARLNALRGQLVAKGFGVSGGQCASSLEFATLPMCGAVDSRMAVLRVPRSQFPQALGEGWRPFLNGVNGELNTPGC